MAAGDLIMAMVVDGVPSFPCGPCGPAKTCGSTYASTLNIRIADVVPTGCFEITSISPPAVRFYEVVSFTGINGDHTLTASGLPANSAFSGTIGTVTLQETGGASPRPSATCNIPLDPVPDPITLDVTFFMGCDYPGNPSSPGGIGTFGLFGSSAISPTGDGAALVFTTGVTTFFPPATAPSVLDGTDISGSGYYIDAFKNGTVQVL